MGASSACDLPRNRQQVKNLKYSSKPHPQSSSISGGSSDILAHVMEMCKESFRSGHAFVRSVEAAPEPMCVLATDQQLVDMERFCTGDPSSVLSIDPTFNLGAFYVTPITYHNLLVERAGGNNPILLGPVLVHQTKTFRPFHYFATTLIRLNPQLVNLKAFGTDGEVELIKAFDVCFLKAVHLRCTNHIRQNIKGKLNQLNIPQSISKDFLADIFGSQIGTHFEAGLADAESEASFTKSLQRVKARWNNLERSCSVSEKEPQFHAWFCQYKAEDIAKCVLPNVRRRAGCKDPIRFFTTNSSESLNHMIKQEVDWKESKLPSLIDSLKSMADEQKSELEKTVIGCGEWHFTPEHNKLMVTESCWFSQMTDAAKKAHMKNVFSQIPINAHSTKQSKTTQVTHAKPKTGQHATLSVPVEEREIIGVAESTLQNIWAKAERLVTDIDGHITNVPWSEDDRHKLVKSSSSPQPHLVTTNQKNKGLYCCDKKCPMFKGFSICAHIIATAHINGDLKCFLDNVNGACGPNLTEIANRGMPSGVGRKGGVAKRKRNRRLPDIETRSVRPLLDVHASQPAAITMPSLSTSSSGIDPPSPSLPTACVVAHSPSSSSE